MTRIELMILLGIIVASFGSGYWLANNQCHTEKLTEQNKSLNDSLDKTAELTVIAENVVNLNKKSDKILNKVNKETINAKDSSFGCIVNPDGMRLTAETIAISSDTSRIDE